MRLLARSTCLLASLCIAAPASAGFSSSGNYGRAPSAKSPVFVGESGSVSQPRSPVLVEVQPQPPMRWDVGEAKERIRDARESGLISRREARKLGREADVLASHADLYARDGLSDSERHELNTRALYLISVINAPSSPINGVK